MTPLGWAALGAALLLIVTPAPTLGRRSASRRAARRSTSQGGAEPQDVTDPGPGDTVRAAWTIPVALAGLAGAGVLLFGLVRGGVVAALVCPAVWMAVRQLAARRPPAPPDRRVALALDLCAAALRAGRTPSDAIAAAADAASPSVRRQLQRVAGLLRLGAEPAQAWSAVDPAGPLVPIAAVAVRSATSGVRSAASFERLAGEIRADAAARSAERAQRAGVQAMAPLAACFLPSFVCLGIVPVVVGIAGSVTGVLR